MCDIKSEATPIGMKGEIVLDVTCKKTGLPITVSNEYGMFCRKMCDLGKNKAAKLVAMMLFRGVAGVFELRDKFRK